MIWPVTHGRAGITPPAFPRAAWAGTGLAVLITGLLVATLAALLAQAGNPRPGPADWAALWFTLAQAAMSALISALLAVPVARALARRRFVGRAALIAALGVPFLLPVIVAVLALLAVFGRNGVVNAGLAGLGLPAVQIYGPQGVVLAHVFLNLPLVVRMLLHGWQAIPAERVRLAQSLGLGPGGLWRHVEWPMLRAVLPGAALAVFLICLTSFAVALILGGGPRATTVELAIYQALRFDFDLPRAAVLACGQFALCALAVLLAARWTRVPAGGGLDRPLDLPCPGGWRRMADAGAIAAAAMFLLVPLLVVVLRGAPGLARLPPEVWQAALRSLALALAVAGLTGVALLALGLVAGRPGRLGRWVELAGMLPMAASPLVLGTGLFLMLNPIVSPPALALPVTALVNTLLALPFALRLVLPAWRAAEATHGRLADALGLTGTARLRHAILPRLRRPLGMALGLAAALAMGDLGVIALFATEGNATLPLQVWRLMGAYRTDAAQSAALLLVLLSLSLFLLFDLWGRRHADP